MDRWRDREIGRDGRDRERWGEIGREIERDGRDRERWERWER